MELRQNLSFVTNAAVGVRDFFWLRCRWQQCSSNCRGHDCCTVGQIALSWGFLVATEIAAQSAATGMLADYQHSFSTWMKQRLGGIYFLSYWPRVATGFWFTDLASGCTVHLVVSLWITQRTTHAFRHSSQPTCLDYLTAKDIFLLLAARFLLVANGFLLSLSGFGLLESWH